MFFVCKVCLETLSCSSIFKQEKETKPNDAIDGTIEMRRGKNILVIKKRREGRRRSSDTWRRRNINMILMKMMMMKSKMMIKFSQFSPRDTCSYVIHFTILSCQTGMKKEGVNTVYSSQRYLSSERGKNFWWALLLLVIWLQSLTSCSLLMSFVYPLHSGSRVTSINHVALLRKRCFCRKRAEEEGGKIYFGEEEEVPETDKWER